MTTQHTPERLMLYMVQKGSVYLMTDENYKVATVHLTSNGEAEQEAIGRRLHASYNACQGINPEAIKELLEAAELVHEKYNTLNGDHFRDVPEAPMERLRLALAKAKAVQS